MRQLKADSNRMDRMKSSAEVRVQNDELKKKAFISFIILHSAFILALVRPCYFLSEHWVLLVTLNI
jgi:hypothetical protein